MIFKNLFILLLPLVFFVYEDYGWAVGQIGSYGHNVTPLRPVVNVENPELFDGRIRFVFKDSETFGYQVEAKDKEYYYGDFHKKVCMDRGNKTFFGLLSTLDCELSIAVAAGYRKFFLLTASSNIFFEQETLPTISPAERVDFKDDRGNFDVKYYSFIKTEYSSQTPYYNDRSRVYYCFPDFVLVLNRELAMHKLENPTKEDRENSVELVKSIYSAKIWNSMSPLRKNKILADAKDNVHVPHFGFEILEPDKLGVIKPDFIDPQTRVFFPIRSAEKAFLFNGRKFEFELESKPGHPLYKDDKLIRNFNFSVRSVTTK